MNVVLECDFTLPKKMEAICENGEPISIHITSVSGNKCRAIMRMVCKEGVSEADILKIGDTSIPMRVTAVHDDVKALESVGRISNLIGGHIPTAVEAAIARTSPDIKEGEPFRKPVEKLVQRPVPVAMTPEPEVPAVSPQVQPGMNPEAMKLLFAALAAAGLPAQAVQAVQGIMGAQSGQQATATATSQSRPVAPPENSIMTYDELMSEISSVPGINDIIKIPTDRKLSRGEAETLMARMPKLRKQAYLRNSMQSTLMVDDLFTSIDGTGPCLTLMPGMACDLTRMPARNIMNSNALKWCFETGKVELVGRASFVASFKKVQEDANLWAKSELTVYGGTSARTSPHDAEEGTAFSLAAGSGMSEEGEGIHIGGRGPDVVSLGPSDSGGDAPPAQVWEDNPHMQQLISQMPAARQQAAAAPKRVR